MDRNGRYFVAYSRFFAVALRKESVDRNSWFIIIDVKERVALRKESVDRNKICCQGFRFFWVALRKESVDRNGKLKFDIGSPKKSLSARRAWIEINRQAVQSAYK